CELHAHTTWSDGALSVRELCDLHGRRGFDVLAVTDHTHRIDLHVTTGRFDAYLAEIEAEAERARELYGLLVLPGLELTYDDPNSELAAQAGRPAVATGDFHRLEHLATWKTLVPCAKGEEAVVEYLRSARPVYLVRLDEQLAARAA